MRIGSRRGLYGTAMARLLHCLSVLFLLGCSAEGPANDVGGQGDVGADEGVASGPVMDHEAWVAVAAADDPFDDRPDTVNCERGVGWDLELLDVDETVAVETGDCNYLGLSQPLLRSFASSETLAVQIWHFQLEGGGPAHAAVAIDGVVVWEMTIPIPSESGLIYEEFSVPDGAPLGAPLVFHLHNHGLNSWNFIAVRSPDP